MSTHAQPPSSADTLRAYINTQLAIGTLPPRLAETLHNAVADLEARARLGQQLGALGQAATAPKAVQAPALPYEPVGRTKWARHQEFSENGKPPPRESAADLKARLQAESIGYVGGRFVPIDARRDGGGL